MLRNNPDFNLCMEFSRRCLFSDGKASPGPKMSESEALFCFRAGWLPVGTVDLTLDC